jgi:hypothetical protein
METEPNERWAQVQHSALVKIHIKPEPDERWALFHLDDVEVYLHAAFIMVQGTNLDQ